MKTFVGLILVLGLAAVGWMYRNKLSETWASAGLPAVGNVPSLQAATPHPAREAQAQAVAIYPGLALPNSALNRRFLTLHKEAQVNDPALLSEPDWPLQLAERAIVSLGAAPLPRGTPVAASAPVRGDKQVVIYTTSHCPYCVKAKEYFAQKGIHYREVDIERSITGKDAYRRLGGNGVPLIMVGTKKVEGFDPQALDRLL